MEPDLTALGLTQDEAALYLLLLDRSGWAPEELAGEWAADRGPVGPLLRSLQIKGLVTTLAGATQRHAAIAPNVALDNLTKAREQEVAAARAHVGLLTERWQRAGRTAVPGDLVEIVVGREATLQRAEQIQRAATREVLIVDAPPYARGTGDNRVEMERLERGEVTYRCLYDRSGLQLPERVERVRRLVDAGEKARVSSGLPLKLVMGDESVALLPLDAAPASITAAVVVHPSALLSSLVLMVEGLWRDALPLFGVPGLSEQPPGTVGAARDEEGTLIVQLLVTGMTDHAIARQLGLAERTIQRRVSQLMQSMGVTNRLQLGIRLAQDGWAS